MEDSSTSGDENFDNNETRRGAPALVASAIVPMREEGSHSASAPQMQGRVVLQEDNQSQHASRKVNFFKFFASMDEEVFDRPAAALFVRDIDVLPGTDESLNSIPGNRKYRGILAHFHHEYRSLSTQQDSDKQQYIAFQIYKAVREGGTRFLKRSQASGLLEEQSMAESLDKIMIDLRSNVNARGDDRLYEDGPQHKLLVRTISLEDVVMEDEELFDRIPQDTQANPEQEWKTSTEVQKQY